MEEINRLEEKVEYLVKIVGELKQKIETLEQEKSRLESRDNVIKEKLTGLIDKIDNLAI